jgi:acyl-CoA reductase-like NAD-dependent aldehyde dehydrogenase
MSGSTSTWPTTPIRERLRVIRQIRHLLAAHPNEILAAIPTTLSRNPADTLAAELLPLLEAAKFLERQAATILAPKRLGKKGLPFWLSGLDATITRAPLGAILIIAPSNYPLFLPGVQTLQALAAGNTVVWKPGTAGEPIAHLFAHLCAQAGLPANTLRITDDSIEAAADEITRNPAKILFTGSAHAGRAVQHLAADHSIPVIAELSGCDAILALPSAEPKRLAEAILFGMRLNGAATCMAPRRLLLVGDHRALLADLQTRFAAADPIPLADSTRRRLQSLLDEAEPGLHSLRTTTRPILIANGNPSLAITRTDIFAPVLTALQTLGPQAAIAQINENPYALTAAIFGDEAEAKQIATQLEVGTVLINDLIAPTADPRIPFGGRRQSGFGSTRGAQGLLELTAPRVVTTRRNSESKHFQPTTPAHEQLFRGVITMSHAKSWRTRYTGLQQIVTAARTLNPARKKLKADS